MKGEAGNGTPRERVQGSKKARRTRVLVKRILGSGLRLWWGAFPLPGQRRAPFGEPLTAGTASRHFPRVASPRARVQQVQGACSDPFDGGLRASCRAGANDRVTRPQRTAWSEKENH